MKKLFFGIVFASSAFGFPSREFTKSVEAERVSFGVALDAVIDEIETEAWREFRCSAGMYRIRNTINVSVEQQPRKKVTAKIQYVCWPW